MKKQKKSFSEILKTHPFPGLRIERDENGEPLIHLGRPGVFSRAVPLNYSGPEAEASEEAATGTEEAPQVDRTEPAVADSPSEAELIWLEGAKIWEQVQIAPFDERRGLEDQAAELFGRALDLDPMMTDALLGIHATCPERREEMIEAMFVLVERFGETRNRLGQRLHSVYFPLVFSAEPLETIDDLLRARAKSLAVAGQIEEARNTLAAAEDCLLNDLTAIDILFHEGRHADAIVSIQASQGHAELSEFTENDLLLLQAVSFLRQGHTTVAVKMLEELAGKARLQAVQHFARYEMANLAIRENAPDLAREQLEILISQDPNYRDARQVLAEIEGIDEDVEFYDTPEENPVFDQLVNTFYSEDVADDPSLPDNQI